MNIMSLVIHILSGYPVVLPYASIYLDILDSSHHLLLKGEESSFKYPFKDLDTPLHQCFSSPFCVGHVCPPPDLVWCIQGGRRSFSLHPLSTPFLALCAQPYLTNSLEFFKSLCLSLLSPQGSSIPLLLSLFCTLEYSVLLYSHHLLFTLRALTHVVDPW